MDRPLVTTNSPPHISLERAIDFCSPYLCMAPEISVNLRNPTAV